MHYPLSQRREYSNKFPSILCTTCILDYCYAGNYRPQVLGEEESEPLEEKNRSQRKVGLHPSRNRQQNEQVSRRSQKCNSCPVHTSPELKQENPRILLPLPLLTSRPEEKGKKVRLTFKEERTQLSQILCQMGINASVEVRPEDTAHMLFADPYL